MKDQLEKIYNLAQADIACATGINDLDEVKLKYLSRKGEFNSIKKGLKDLSDEDKKTIGAFANEISQDLENKIKEKYEIFYKEELDKKLKNERIDITLPGKNIPWRRIN